MASKERQPFRLRSQTPSEKHEQTDVRNSIGVALRSGDEFGGNGAFKPDPAVCFFGPAREYLATGDFNGDGLTDIALVARPTGGVRFGYARGDGTSTGQVGGGPDSITSKALRSENSWKPRLIRSAFASVNENYVTLLTGQRSEPRDRPQMIQLGNRIPGCVLASSP